LENISVKFRIYTTCFEAGYWD